MRNILTLIILLLFNVLVNAQGGTVLNPDTEPRDGYYPRLKKPILFETFYQVRYLQDTNWKSQLYQKQTMLASAYERVKLPSFKDCILINDTKTWSQKRANNFNSLFTYTSYEDTTILTGSSLLAYYSSSATVDSLMNVTITSEIPVEEYLEPFYLRRMEVTNKEYREFVVWVRDSLARMLLGYSDVEGFMIPNPEDIDPPRLNWKTPIKWNDPLVKEILYDLYYPEDQRYYRRREFDVRKFIYDYTDATDGKRIRTRINIYPDTLCWIRDFDQAETDQLYQTYFWNETFNDYPVVGISWWQAKAYLHWKEKKLSEELGSKYPGLSIHLALPTVMEWELAQTDLKMDFPTDDDPWLCDLILGPENNYADSLLIDQDTTFTKIEHVYYNDGWPRDGVYEKVRIHKYYNEVSKDTTLIIDGNEYERKIRQRFIRTEKTRFNSIFPPLGNSDEVSYQFPFLMAPSDLSELSKNLKFGEKGKYPFPNEMVICTDRIKNNLLSNEVSFLSGNVSEWMENNDEGWRIGFQMHMQQRGVEDKLQFQAEKQGGEKNDSGGRLIKGSNWLHNAVKQVNAGAHVQRFADPDKGFCTVGFRYVIHFEWKK